MWGGVAKTGRRKVATVVTCAPQGKRRRCLALNPKDVCILPPPHLLPQEVVLASMWHSSGPVQSPLDSRTRLGTHRTR